MSPSPSAGSLTALLRVFSHPHYRTYATGNFLSLVGMWMQRVTVGWLTWDLTGSGTWLGLIVFVELFPVLMLGPLAGALADRHNLLVQVRITQLVSVLQSVLLALLFIAGHLDIGWLLALSLVLGLNSPFYQAARLAVVPALVPAPDLGAAIACNAILFNLARFAGPAAAGLVIASAGLGWSFVANALACFAFFVALLFIPDAIAVPVRRERNKSLLRDMLEGFRSAMASKGLRTIFLLTIAMGLAGRPVIELLPGFADALYAGGAEGLAALMAAVGIGAMIGGFYMIGRPPGPGLMRIYVTSTISSGIAIIAFVLAAGHLLLALPVVAALGGFMVISGIASQTLVHYASDGALLGRMLSLWGVLQRGVPALGTLLLGILADGVGMPMAGLVAGALLSASIMSGRLTRHRQRQ